MKRFRVLALVLLIALLFSGNGCGIIPALIKPTAAPTETAAPTPAPTAKPAPTPEPTEAPEITSGVHKGERDYFTYFVTRVIEKERCSVQMDYKIFSAEALISLADTVDRDMAAIAERAGEPDRRVTVYIVDKLESGASPVSGDHMFCTPEEVESGEYRTALMDACFGLTIPWKQYGLYEFVFGDHDYSGLQRYYLDKRNMYTASCAAVYISPLSADAKTLEMGRKTAASITAYVLNNGGLERLREIRSTKEVISDWMKTEDVFSSFILPEEDEEVAGMTVLKDAGCLFAVRLDNLVFRITESSFMKTPAELYTFLVMYVRGMKAVWKTIEDEAPAFVPYAETRAGATITITVTTADESYTYGNNIVLGFEESIWHELTHVLMNESEYDPVFWWQCEAIAEHFSLPSWDAVWRVSEEEYISGFAALIRSYALGSAISSEEAEKCISLFTAVYYSLRAEHGSAPEGYLDHRLTERALGICALLLPDSDIFDRRSVASTRGSESGPIETDGNALTYNESMAFFEYLMDTYGAETVLRGYMYAKPIEETCGKTYDKLFADFMRHLKNMYGSYLR
ncbi:MAG: hypothetical protein K6F68_05030 [Clostridiales bacterium]|nr:hypothetical protein [Clostridiales bacterium]